MPTSLEQIALVAYLREKDPVFYGKVLELRDVVRGWLSYIPQTFPHYTRHTIEHSEEMILQASKMLFENERWETCVLTLSAVEAYMIIVAAYLHDAGMVVSDAEKAKILESEEWCEWTHDGGGAARWEAIAALRSGRRPADGGLRDYLADVQTRFLIAEFIRRRHHLGAVDVISQHHAALAGFDFGDLVLRKNIANVCLGHGLRAHELEDKEGYPDRCDIRGEVANVRFVAIVLRLADLLDMSQDRACPLLLNAACPLPADSLAHWSKYGAITQRLTAHNEIRIHAECQEQEQQRVLRDWCEWLTREVAEARTLMARCKRHGEWQVPVCAMEGPEPTIVIRPRAGATYIPLDWTFDLDADEVFGRLVYDLYESPQVFIRELIQNGLDATRCRLYADLAAEGLEIPESPAKVAADRRSGYAVRVGVHEVETENRLSGETELRQVVTVEDQGIGMDKEIIQRYLLQIGRSYYTTDEFRRSFGFIPSSRFGIGFLSVFGASDYVVLETFKPSSPAGDGPIRLTLTGPRNYLLVEHGTRGVSGTRIEVLLRERMEPGTLTGLVREWCRRVEFPIIVDDLGSEIIIEREGPDNFAYEIPDLSEEGATFSVRALPFSAPSVEGEVYIFVRSDSRGESWVDRSWAMHQYPLAHPQATVPPYPSSLSCFNGMAVGRWGWSPGGPSVRVDYRGEIGVTASRRGFSGMTEGLEKKVAGPANAVLEEALREHLVSTRRAQGPGGWRYKQRLVREFRGLAEFWRSWPETVPAIRGGGQALMSLEEIQGADLVTVALHVVPKWQRDYGREEMDEKEMEEVPLGVSVGRDGVVMVGDDVERLSSEHRAAIFERRSVSNVTRAFSFLLLEWRVSDGSDYVRWEGRHGPTSVVAMPDENVIGFAVHKTTDDIYSHCLLNRGNAFVQWLLRVRDATEKGQFGLTNRQFSQIISLLSTPVAYGGHELSDLSAYLGAWRRLPGLPQELHPPDLDVKMFEAWRVGLVEKDRSVGRNDSASRRKRRRK